MIKRENIYYWFISLSLVVFFTADSLTKVLQVNGGEYTRISLLVRAVFEVALILILAIGYKKKFAPILLGVFLLIYIHFTGQLGFGTSYSSIIIFENVAILNKYIFILLLAVPVYEIADDKLTKKLIVTFGLIVLINSFFVIAGFLFDIRIFESYYHQSYRFGYSGLIPKQNEATLFYLIGLGYAYYKMKYNHGSKIYFLVILCATLLVGTKGLYLFVIALAAYHMISIKSTVAFVGFSVISLAGIFYIPFLINTSFMQYFIFQAEKYGVITMLLSGRAQKVVYQLDGQLEHWNIVNYLFGGTDIAVFASEMDFIDLFSFFGLIGSFIYIFMYLKFVFPERKTNFQKFFVCCFFLLSFFGGHFLYSAVNSIYLLIFSRSIQTKYLEK